MARIPPRLLSAEPDRREVLRSLGALSIGAASGLPARAQSFPSRQITMVFPAAPGSPSDLVGRRIAKSMAAQANVRVIADNKAGANSVSTPS